MKKILFILAIFLLLPFTIEAADWDSTTTQIATAIYERLGMDTSGTDRYPRQTAKEDAQSGINKTGQDIGQATSKKLALAANVNFILLDTLLVDGGVLGVTYDSVGAGLSDTAAYPRRWLKEVPISELKGLQFSAAIVAGKHPTHFAVIDDSLMFAPVSVDVDTVSAHYMKRANNTTDTTVTVTLAMKYREIALNWSCHLASMKLENGRAEEFLGYYASGVNDVLNKKRRIGSVK